MNPPQIPAHLLYHKLDLSPTHAKELADSGVDPEVAYERGYRTAKTKQDVKNLGFANSQAVSGGLVLPVWNVHGDIVTYQVKLDQPRAVRDKILKYESVKGSTATIDVHPRVKPALADPSVPLYFTEGSKKNDAVVSQGAMCVALMGVWSWRGTNNFGGKQALPDFEHIALNGRQVILVFDSDVMVKKEVSNALSRLGRMLTSRGAEVLYGLLENDGSKKTGIDDYLVAGGKLEDIPTFTSPPVPEGDDDFEYTDVGNAERFYHHNGDQFRYTRESGWLAWDGVRYRLDSESLARAAAEKATESIERGSEWYYRSRSSNGLSNMLRESQRKCFAELTDFDTDPNIIATPSGIVDLRTADIRETLPTDLVTKKTSVGVDLGREPQEFLKFIGEIFLGDEDLINYVLHALGASLFGFTADQLFFMALGSGANGKSVLLDIVAEVTGNNEDGYGGTMPPGLLLKRNSEPHPTELADLRGKRFSYTSENSSEGTLDESKLKRLTGGDQIKARYLNRDFFTFSATWSLWMATNSLPKLEEGGLAFWRRARVIPFDLQVPPEKRIPNLGGKLVSKEGPQILGLLVKYAASYHKNGLPEVPKRILEATSEYKAQEDSVEGFLSEQCDFSGNSFDPDFKIGSAQLRGAYESWCTAEGLEIKSAQVFKARIKARGAKDIRLGKQGSGGRGFGGVRLKREAVKDTSKNPKVEVESASFSEKVPPECHRSDHAFEENGSVKPQVKRTSDQSDHAFSSFAESKNETDVRVSPLKEEPVGLEDKNNLALPALIELTSTNTKIEGGTEVALTEEEPFMTIQERWPAISASIQGFDTDWVQEYIDSDPPTPCPYCGADRVYGGWAGDRFVCPVCFPDEVNPR